MLEKVPLGMLLEHARSSNPFGLEQRPGDARAVWAGTARECQANHRNTAPREGSMPLKDQKKVLHGGYPGHENGNSKKS